MELEELVEKIKKEEATSREFAKKNLNAAIIAGVLSGLIYYTTKSPATEVMLSLTVPLFFIDIYFHIKYKKHSENLRQKYPVYFEENSPDK